MSLEAPQPVPEIAPADAYALLQAGAARLLDVREPDEYAAAHVDGAQLLPLGELSARLAADPTDVGAALSEADRQAAPLIVICRSGRRSAEAVRLFQQAGLSDARNLTGGIIAWRAAGLPVVE